MRSLSSSLFLLFTLSVASLAGCSEDSSSGEARLPATGGSAGVGNAGSGGAGSSGASGQGGSTAAGTGGSAGSTAAGTGGSAGSTAAGAGGSAGSTVGQPCGGLTPTGTPTCGPDEFCYYTAADMCSAADAPGVCKKRPTSCPAGCTTSFPVCGCSGQLYCSECEASKSGEGIYGTCQPTGTTFACGGKICRSESEYCEFEKSDVTTIPDTYACKPLPSSCGPTPSCACLKQEPCGQFTNSCKATGGGFTLSCPAG